MATTTNYLLYKPSRDDMDTDVDTSLSDNFVTIDTEIKNRANDIGTVANLTTTDKASLVKAINEHDSEIGTLSNLTTTDKTSLVVAVNELDSVKLEGLLTDSDIDTNAGIKASKLAIQKLYKKSQSANPSAIADTNGTVVDTAPVTGYVSLIPQAIDVVFGGTFGTETVTADITVTFSDATTAIVTKTATATGTTSLTNTDLMTLAKDGVFINKISVKSKSSIADSTATATFNHYGIYL
jgi:hypothetical protein